MRSTKLVSTLLFGALLLPAAVLVVGGFGRLLSGLGDRAGGLFFERVALTGAVLWLLDLLALLLATAARLAADDTPPGEKRPGNGLRGNGPPGNGLRGEAAAPHEAEPDEE